MTAVTRDAWQPALRGHAGGAEAVQETLAPRGERRDALREVGVVVGQQRLELHVRTGEHRRALREQRGERFVATGRRRLGQDLVEPLGQ